MKKIVVSLMALFAIMGVCAHAQTVQVTIDSNDVYVQDEYIMKNTLDVAAYIQNDITMVPLRFISETLGCEIQWDHDAKKVTVTKADETVVLTIGDINAVSSSGGQTKTTQLLAAPVILNDRTMVPLRFVSENLGCYVEYIEPTRQVLITDETPAVVVGEIPIYKSLFRTYYLYNVAYMDYYTPELFNRLVYENVVHMAIIESQWSVIDSNRSILPEDLETVLAIGDEGWAMQGMLSANVVRLLQMGSITQRAYDALYKSVGEDLIMQSYTQNYVCAKHILFSTQGLSPSEKDAVKKQAEDVLKKAKSGADFDELILQYGEDPGMVNTPDGYVFTYGQMVEGFETAAFALGENEISDLVETEYGYHIIKRLPLPQISEGTKESIVESVVGMVTNGMIQATPVVSNMTQEELFSYMMQSSVG